MKVLWFSLSPCGALRRSGQQKFTQTWMTTLEDKIKKMSNIDLFVSYYVHSQDQKEPFDYDGVHYFPVLTGKMTFFEKVRKKIGGYNKDFTQENIVELEKIVRKVNPDIIHVHDNRKNKGYTYSCLNTGIYVPYCREILCWYFHGGGPKN